MPWAEISLEQPQSRSVGDPFVAHWPLSRLAGRRHSLCSGAPRRWGMGTLELPVLLLVKVAGSTHFPVFFCQRWEKSPNILPAYESKTPWRDWEKPSLRATLRRLCPPPGPQPPIPTTLPNQCELLALLPSTLCLCLQDPPKKHTNPLAASCSNSDGINIAWYLFFCLFKWDRQCCGNCDELNRVFCFFCLAFPLEYWDWESTLATVAGDSIVWQGAACLRDAAISLKTPFFFLDCLYCSDGLHRCVTLLPRTELDACFNGDKIVALIRE